MTQYIDLVCSVCAKQFSRDLRFYKSSKKQGGETYRVVCSQQCSGRLAFSTQTFQCDQCNKPLQRQANQAKKYTHHFCSQSCSATYTNQHKATGTRRSKLEQWIESQLTSLYPALEIHFNRKDAIDSELDIFIPSLNFAVELNGIFHYEPIYGVKKLASIKNNDNRKFQACLERKIELLIVDTSSHTRSGDKRTYKQYLDIITRIIDRKLVDIP